MTRVDEKLSDINEEIEALRLAAEAGEIVRETAKHYLGGNCTFVCGDIHMLGALAQRAVLAGLHSDMHSDRTRRNMERAAEATRADHEAALGRPICNTSDHGIATPVASGPEKAI